MGVGPFWSSHIWETVRATNNNMLSYSTHEFCTGIQWGKNNSLDKNFATKMQ
jgi:hypothetical protein